MGTSTDIPPTYIAQLNPTSRLQLTVNVCGHYLSETINSGSPKYLGKERDDLIQKRDKAKAKLILMGKPYEGRY